MITVADHPISEKPPEYNAVVLEPPCYDDAIKLSPVDLMNTKYYNDMSLPSYNEVRIECETYSHQSQRQQTITPNTSSSITKCAEEQTQGLS